MIAEQQHQCEQSSISSVEVELGEKLKEIEVEMSDKNKVCSFGVYYRLVLMSDKQLDFKFQHVMI